MRMYIWFYLFVCVYVCALEFIRFVSTPSSTSGFSSVILLLLSFEIVCRRERTIELVELSVGLTLLLLFIVGNCYTLCF